MQRKPAAWLFVPVAACCIAGCASGPEEIERPAIATARDPQATATARIEAIGRVWDSVQSGEAAAESTREALKSIAWSRSTYWTIRAAAIDELMEDVERRPDTANMLRLMLPTEPDPKIVEKACAMASAHGWKELAPAIVRRWSRPLEGRPDAERPENAALAALFPERPVADSIFEVFIEEGRSASGEALTGPEALRRERERLAAWTLLQRVDPGHERTANLLAGVTDTGGDPLLEALSAGARELRLVPGTGEQLDWLKRLRAAEGGALWRRSAELVARLDGAQARGLALRHMGALRWADAHHSPWLGMSTGQLLEEAAQELKGRERVARAAASDSGRDELLATWKDSLCWGDALLLLVALKLESDTDSVGALFAIAEKDKQDTSTEHGGVIGDGGAGAPGAGGRFTVFHYPPRPMQRQGDRNFEASPDLLENSTGALFHFHMHAQKYTNAEYAGPSSKDLDYAETFGAACIVFTFVAQNRLNADLYLPTGAIIDVGVLHKAG